MPSAYNTRLPTDMILDTGILQADITTPGTLETIGVSRGGLNFDPGSENHEVEYDGRRAPVMGLDRKVFMRPKITGTMLLAGPKDLRLYEFGGTGSGNVVTVKPANVFLIAGDYHKFALIFSRSGYGATSPGTVTITFPVGLVMSYSIAGKDKDEGELAVEIEARQNRDDAGSSDGETLYTIVITDPV